MSKLLTLLYLGTSWAHLCSIIFYFFFGSLQTASMPHLVTASWCDGWQSQGCHDSGGGRRAQGLGGKTTNIAKHCLGFCWSAPSASRFISRVGTRSLFENSICYLREVNDRRRVCRWKAGLALECRGFFFFSFMARR